MSASGMMASSAAAPGDRITPILGVIAGVGVAAAGML